MKTIATVLLLWVSLAIQAQESRIHEIDFLLGKYQVQVLLPDGKGGWSKGGSGTATFDPVLGNNFIREELNLTFGQGTLTMINHFGRDGRMNQLRMIAMDKEFATMDFYNGEVIDQKVVFENTASDIPFRDQDGNKISFRITYSQKNSDTNESLVELTKDEGETWMPYSKQLFIRE